MVYTIEESQKYADCYNVYDERGNRVVYFDSDECNNLEDAKKWVDQHSKPAKLVCAAVKDATGKLYLGKRHSDCLWLMYRFDLKNDVGSIQGFVDTNMNFFNRNEAVRVAFKAGQIDFDQTEMNNKQLFSEDLY